jgi:hypothetical protein
MLFETAVAATLFAFFLVLTPGAFLLAALTRRQWLPPQEFSGNFVLAAALGSVWSALVFLALYRLHAFSLPRGGMLGHAALNLALIAAISLTLRPLGELRAILASFRSLAFLALLGCGLSLGGWALHRFPHVFDSGQLLWTQHVLWEQGGLRDALLSMPGAGYYEVDRLESMFGFSGLIAPLGSLYPDQPLVTLAAGLKPFLVLLLLCTCRYIVEMLDLPKKGLCTALLAVAMLGSQFGSYGVLKLGKDSIYGMVFCAAFLVALGRSDRQTRGVEAAILFCAASVTGVIAVPYMMVALALWLVFAADLAQARVVMRPLLAVNALTLPLVISAMLHKPFWPLALAYLAGGAFLIFLLNPRFADRYSAWQGWAGKIVPVLPLLFFALSAALLPATADMPVWANADGSIVTERRAPLDGQTGMLALFFDAGTTQKITVAVALMALAFAAGRRTSRAFSAVAAMPFATIAIVLTHLKLGLGVLTVFNQWDLIKDVPLWLGGAFLSVVAVEAVGRTLPTAGAGWRFDRIAAVALAVLVAGAIPKSELKKLFTPGLDSGVFAPADPDLMATGEIIWKHLPNRTVLAAKDVLPAYFYSLQMYGGRPSQYNASTLDGDLSKLGKIGLAVPREEIFFIASYALEKSASLTYMAPLAGGTQAFLFMEFDGKGRMSLPDMPELQSQVATIRSGVYDQENVAGASFHWTQNAVALDVPITETVACVRFQASAATVDERPKIVSVKGDVARLQNFDLKGSTLTGRQDIRITAQSDQHLARLQLDAAMPDTQFPNDGRRISWAIFTPIQVDQGKACSD